MLSVIVITKNEENNINDCIDSVKNVADEIIVVDSYSTDKTVKKAKSYKCKVYLRKFTNDGAKQRNYAMSKAKGDWILSIDADERVSNNLRRVIPKLIGSEIYNGYLIPRRNYIDNSRWLKYGLFYPDYQLRLFRKKGVKFIHPLHTYPNVDEKRVKKIREYFIHNSSRTKYNSFLSLNNFYSARHNYVLIESKYLLEKNKSLVYYLANSLYESFKYFVDGYILGKGFLDGWIGLRAAIIFSIYRILIGINIIKLKYKIK